MCEFRVHWAGKYFPRYAGKLYCQSLPNNQKPKVLKSGGGKKALTCAWFKCQLAVNIWITLVPHNYINKAKLH